MTAEKVLFSATWVFAGIVGMWFARVVLTIPTSVCLVLVLVAAVAAASFFAGWQARGGA